MFISRNINSTADKRQENYVNIVYKAMSEVKADVTEPRGRQ